MLENIGHYKVSKMLGQGSLAVVYQAHDPILNRDVALKILHPIFSKNPKNISRLRQEAQTLAQLDHPNIIRIYSFLDEEVAKGIVTQFVDGQTLAELLREHSPLLPEIACRIMCDVMSALEHAHLRRIVHRDIKPENIIISPDGEVKLADFSIAKILNKESLTVTGQLVGSPLYLSPEQARGDKIDERSDLFSAGILFFQMLTGKPPYFDENPVVVLKKIISNPPDKLSLVNPKISKQLETIVLKALEKDKKQRYQKAWEFRYAILEYLKTNHISYEDIELKHFFTKPAEYSKTLTQQLSSHYLEEGKKAFAEKDWVKTSQLWNKSLEYNPQDPQVLKELKKLTRSKIYVGAKKTFLLLIILAVGLGGYHLYSTFQKTDQRSSQASTEASRTPSLQGDLSPMLETSKETKVSTKETPPPPRQTVKQPERRFAKPTVKPPPTAWSYLKVNKDEDSEFYVDGEYYDLSDSNIVKLKPGTHKIKLTKPGFRDIEANIAVKKGETATINVKTGT
ncbi:MAG TPA: serine/threonine-protein kinase [Bdellovibrionota bacterium]|nr:serine/threonine-protein kinase [Bdellovibrionota bacterium]